MFGFVFAGNIADPTYGYPSWNMSLLSTVAFFGLHVDGSGNLVTNDTGWSAWNSSNMTNLLSAAHTNGVRVVLTVILQDNGQVMCSGLANAGTTVQQVVTQVQQKGVDGINIDYEGVNEPCPGHPSSRDMLTGFVQALRQALPSGSYLTVDTYASSAADSSGFFDIAGLAPNADAFFVMAYDLDGNYSGGNWQFAPLNCSSYCFSPAAPLTTYQFNDTSTAQQYTSVIPASKVILGVPYYGWTACVAPLTAGRPGPNATAFPSGTAHWISPRYVDSASNSTTPNYQSARDVHDTAGQEPYATWTSDPSTYNCWRESYWDDATSLGNKYDLVNKDNLRGAGIWTLDFAGGAQELWNKLASKFATPSISSVSPSSGTFSGGQTVTITGQSFVPGANVKFGPNDATVTSISSTQLTVTTPPGVGVVDVTVTDPNGVSAAAPGAYTYNPAPNVRYFTWFDRVSSPGFQGDNVHVVNPSTTAATVVVNIPGSPGCMPSGVIAPGQEKYFSCPTGFGGPVTVNSDQPVLASQRVQYYQSFNEVLAQPASAAQGTLYFTWFDRVSSPGFQSDNIHVVDPGSSAATVTVSILGCGNQTQTIQPGSEQYFTCAGGFGGPVKVSSNQPVLASQRVQYYQSFNEVLGQAPSAAQTTEYFTWFDRVSSPGFQGDNVHVINAGNSSNSPATVTVSIPGCSSQQQSIPVGGEQYFTCASGFGGPVKVSSDQPVLASQRVQYYQSFNEVLGQAPSAAQKALYFTWFDRVSSPGFKGDNVHIVNPGTSTANVTVSIPGCSDQAQSVPVGGEQYFTCASGFGGPVKVSSDQPVLASQRVQYYQSFNEVLGLTS